MPFRGLPPWQIACPSGLTPGLTRYKRLASAWGFEEFNALEIWLQAPEKGVRRPDDHGKIELSMSG